MATVPNHGVPGPLEVRKKIFGGPKYDFRG